MRGRVLGEEHPDTATTLICIGGAHADWGEAEEALRQYRRALGIRERVLGEEHPETARILMNIGNVHNRRGKAEEALRQ